MVKSLPCIQKPLKKNRCALIIDISLGFPSGPVVKNPPAMQETQEMQVQSLGWEDPLKRKWQPLPVLLSGKSTDRGAWRL